MKLIKYLVPLWLGVFTYSLLSVFFGAKGIYSYKQLEAERNREIANIGILTDINTELTGTRDLLSNDKKQYFAYARELGFSAPGENFIRIIGLGGSQKNLASPGNIVTVVPPEHVPERILQIFSFFAAFVMLITIVSYDFLKYLKSRESASY